MRNIVTNGTGKHTSSSIPITTIPAGPALYIGHGLIGLCGADIGIYNACHTSSLGCGTGAVEHSC
jgi:hypothetical protein